MDKVVQLFEKADGIVNNTNSLGVFLVLVPLYALTLPIWLPLYMVAKFISVRTQ